MATLAATDCCRVALQLVSNSDRAEIVFGIGSNEYAGSKIEQVSSAYRAVLDVFIPALQEILSEQTSIVGVSIEGIIPGFIPQRNNFPLDTYPGLVTGDALPCSVGAIIVRYADPEDVSPGNRTSVTHNTIPGVPESGFIGKVMTDAFATAVQSFATAMVDGLLDPTPTGAPALWKLVQSSAGKAFGDSVRQSIQALANEVIGIVRRRDRPV